MPAAETNLIPNVFNFAFIELLLQGRKKINDEEFLPRTARVLNLVRWKARTSHDGR